MIEKRILCHERVRRIGGSFAFIEHRFLREGFWASLDHHELLLYLFLILASDRYGISFYAYDRICSLLRLSLEEYLEARNRLIDKDLIAFDSTLFQVLSLPERPTATPSSILTTQTDMQTKDPATVDLICRRAFGLKTGAAKRDKGKK